MYAKIDEVEEYSILIPDGGFTCLKDGKEAVVYEDEFGLYVICDEGRHYLDGQLDDGEEYIGFFLKE